MEFSESDVKDFYEWKKTKANISKIEIKPDIIEDKPVLRKEKKERTQKQIDACVKMREGLQKKRETNDNIKNTHSKQYNEKLDKAYEQADTVKDLLPSAKVVVKSHVGRPKGKKALLERPTPAVLSDDEEDIPKKENVTPQVIRNKQRDEIKDGTAQLRDGMKEYLRKLNGY